MTAASSPRSVMPARSIAARFIRRRTARRQRSLLIRSRQDDRAPDTVRRACRRVWRTNPPASAGRLGCADVEPDHRPSMPADRSAMPPSRSAGVTGNSRCRPAGAAPTASASRSQRSGSGSLSTQLNTVVSRRSPGGPKPTECVASSAATNPLLTSPDPCIWMARSNRGQCGTVRAGAGGRLGDPRENRGTARSDRPIGNRATKSSAQGRPIKVISAAEKRPRMARSAGVVQSRSPRLSAWKIAIRAGSADQIDLCVAMDRLGHAVTIRGRSEDSGTSGTSASIAATTSCGATSRQGRPIGQVKR